MRRVPIIIGMFAMVLVLSPPTGVAVAAPMAPMVQNNCLKCHQDFGKMDNVMAGNLGGKSLKAKSIQVKVNNRVELVKFTPDTRVENIPGMKALKSGVALRVHYEMAGKDRVATEIVVKPKIEVPDDQLIGVKELAERVAMGPEKGNYTLVDSRPPGGFMKGHLPTAVSIPFPKMKEMMDKLPADKDRTVIFYCQGYR